MLRPPATFWQPFGLAGTIFGLARAGFAGPGPGWRGDWQGGVRAGGAGFGRVALSVEPKPEGFAERSRGLSAAIPPDTKKEEPFTPQG
jgi:hypothetical protein